jgi:DNA-binding NtrC family response regulator
MASTFSAVAATGAAEAWLTTAGLPESAAERLGHLLAAAGVRIDPVAHDGVVLTDPEHPDATRWIKDLNTRSRLLVVCPPGSTVGDVGWDLLRAGAADVLPWTDDVTVATTVAERLTRWQLVDRLLDRASVRDRLVGETPVWRAVLQEVVEAALFGADVLIMGESGTGKEHLAELVHELDTRPGKKRMVVLDCSTIVPSLSGSEFFGHEKGAFTGASTARAGAFELADGGTLFLDEVGELPVTLQAELLRVIQEHTYKRVGSNTWRRSEFRLICATNCDLAAGQLNGTVRRDFFHRVSGCTLRLPPLRDRPADVVPLVRHFFRRALDGAEPPELSAPVRDLLQRRDYPGNVRDLQSLALRILHRHLGPGEITLGDVPANERPPPPSAG